MSPDGHPSGDTPTPRRVFRAAGRARRLRIETLSFNRLIPNMLTLLALCAGLSAVRYAIGEHWDRAVIAIAAAAFLDGIDGRIARLLRSTSKFGQELDSLADAISFGVAPAMVMYLWSLQHAAHFGWTLSLLFAVCSVLRLARFNTMVGQDLPHWAHNYFTGMPTPAGAGIAILPLIMWLYTDHDLFRDPVIAGAFVLVVSILMVSRVPTFSGKRMRLKPHWVVPLMIVIGLTGALLVTDTWATLSALGIFYLATIPVSVMSFRKLKARPPEPEAAIEEE
ncbi:MAG: CDP-diacylglycerol--serine O-phosphatidyltransferase [Rhodospirillaceae bacterium]|nr:MAG: CDP-diacylglycerol--serine O-phosphatidyltransferase [Rhodospirillaceae bacterium]